GAAHDAPPVGFFVRQAMPPGTAVSSVPRLDRARVAHGDLLRVNFAYTNTAPVALALGGIALLGRPPGATHLSGLANDFTPQPIDRIDAGATVSFQASRTFAAADPTGTWSVFSRLTDLLGVAHDGPEVHFEVGGTADA